MQTNPSYPAIPYLAMSPENSSCFGLILDRGGGRHCHNVFRKVEVGSVVVSISLLIIGPRGASHHYVSKQTPRGALFWSDLVWSGQQDDTYSFVIPTHLRNLSCCNRGSRYGPTWELKRNLLGLMVLDKSLDIFPN
jgi:hypothetical protein